MCALRELSKDGAWLRQDKGGVWSRRDKGGAWSSALLMPRPHPSLNNSRIYCMSKAVLTGL